MKSKTESFKKQLKQQISRKKSKKQLKRQVSRKYKTKSNKTKSIKLNYSLRFRSSSRRSRRSRSFGAAVIRLNGR